MTGGRRPSNARRRELARTKAQQQREAQQRRDRRRRIALQASIGAVLIAVVVVITLVLTKAQPPVTAIPQHMPDGGITISGPDLQAVRGPAATSTTSAGSRTSFEGKVLIQEWEDFGCPACQRFEQTNAAQIEQLVRSGAAVVQYFPVAILDNRFAPGDDYSTRAANAAAAVANWSPDAYRAFHAALFRPGVQPAEGGAGLGDDRLVQIAQQVGAGHLPEIRRAVHDRRFTGWIAARTRDFTHNRGPLAAVDFPTTWQGPSTPTVLVDGHYYDGTTDFGAFVTGTAGSTG
ncbi:DsbA family protein [Amnibacterium endophyticum]|uniref:DsbA family protein n=1 Tax=Amnibacterium endophyticum TaxID=2109337 RepID=A0ABW4LIH7_9MICO